MRRSSARQAPPLRVTRGPRCTTYTHPAPAFRQDGSIHMASKARERNGAIFYAHDPSPFQDLSNKTLTVDATVGPVGAAPLLRRAVALHVHDVEAVHVQRLALRTVRKKGKRGHDDGDETRRRKPVGVVTAVCHCRCPLRRDVAGIFSSTELLALNPPPTHTNKKTNPLSARYDQQDTRTSAPASVIWTSRTRFTRPYHHNKQGQIVKQRQQSGPTLGWFGAPQKALS